MAKTFVLSDGTGPVAAGDLEALKVRAEKMVTAIVGATTFKWETVEETDDDERNNRLQLHRKSGASDRWIYVKTYIDEVALVAAKKKPAGA